ncbi:hypothetical protein SCATT_17740 [Streptantibioticus cattleyicolor NRRL 8057 = DSM 46488]|uniref:Uncharacterized protein n=1 Tax=Streptantibioticus cattleyicolor (strain ATCC 35852 / DSM 46488 / JCM 4925 / NBRC 14057 / NRRL 8057) TaxID=1003195 RepID=F8JS34_STREN|nr:hypothetical protein SCATT_17740 [Streptantibioticus cattleyicolor NRRL 8057 = DSM 46488]MYS58810.1 hypothetical protein [Streptomyces sp. SID5468]CCB74498.1 protein of unknown function [Streptantibioticus cattleyicolor NRRL 8057 = DSM 46488]
MTASGGASPRRFAVEVYQNEYLPQGGDQVDAIVTVTAHGGPPAPDDGPVALRVWTPRHAEVVFVKQVAPGLRDLTGERRAAGERCGEYPTGAWDEGSRDYHLCVRVRPAGVGEEMLAARVSLVARGPAAPVLGQGLVRAVWTAEPPAPTLPGLRIPVGPEDPWAAGPEVDADEVATGTVRLEPPAAGPAGTAPEPGADDPARPGRPIRTVRVEK